MKVHRRKLKRKESKRYLNTYSPKLIRWFSTVNVFLLNGCLSSILVDIDPKPEIVRPKPKVINPVKQEVSFSRNTALAIAGTGSVPRIPAAQPQVTKEQTLQNFRRLRRSTFFCARSPGDENNSPIYPKTAHLPTDSNSKIIRDEKKAAEGKSAEIREKR